MQQFNGGFKSIFDPARCHIVHFGHEYLFSKSLEVADYLTIGLGGSQDILTKQDPYTYGQREEMLRIIIDKRKWTNRVSIVPLLDFGDDKLWFQHCLEQTGGRFDLVGTNNPNVIRIFAEEGYPVLYTGLDRRALLEGDTLRKWLVKGDERWKLFVDESISQKAELYYWQNVKAGLIPGLESSVGKNKEF